MAKDKTWVLELNGQRHTVELEWGEGSEEMRQPLLDDWQREVEEAMGRPCYHLFNTGKIIVDEEIIDEWRAGVTGSLPDDFHFEVGGKPAVLRKKGRIFKEFELYVDGKLVP
ncbi:hypothetical protein ACFLXE_03265 [Chloroflexota bacterium]